MGDFLIILHITLGKHIVGQGSKFFCNLRESGIFFSLYRLKDSKNQ